jgi:NTP pyrophosphatase (non-canonical NTP hydrolase)
MEEKQAMEDEVEKMLDISRANEKPPDSLDDFKDLFRGIYGQGHQYTTTETICFHLFEEVGELARALRNLFRCQSSHLYDAYCEFMNEFADIISWIFALWRKVEYHIKNIFVKGRHTELLGPSKLLNIVLLDHKQWFQDDSNKKSVA